MNSGLFFRIDCFVAAKSARLPSYSIPYHGINTNGHTGAMPHLTVLLYIPHHTIPYQILTDGYLGNFFIFHSRLNSSEFVSKYPNVT
jgi:hypothetical protein